MSYTLTLDCGCSVYVSCDPATKSAHTRILERRGTECPIRKHEVGFRLYLWDLLPDQGTQRRPVQPGPDSPDGLVTWV